MGTCIPEGLGNGTTGAQGRQESGQLISALPATPSLAFVSRMVWGWGWSLVRIQIWEHVGGTGTVWWRRTHGEDAGTPQGHPPENTL